MHTLFGMVVLAVLLVTLGFALVYPMGWAAVILVSASIVGFLLLPSRSKKQRRFSG
jgi:hypothetical protein